MSHYNFVFLSLHSWHGIRQRAHHIAKGLAHCGNTVIFVERTAIRETGEYLQGQHLFQVEDNEKLLVYRLPPMLPYRWLEWTNKVNAKVTASMLQRILRRLEIAQYIVWATFPIDIDVIAHLRPRLVCYDCMDNFPLFFREGSRRKRFFEAMERRMFRAAGIVFASSEGLFKKCRKCHSRVYLVRNAVDLNHFSSVNANQQLPCDDKANPNRPVVGYVGTIGEWIDLDLVARLALENPTWAVVMVGPVHTKVSHLLDIPNLYFLGPVAYDEVPSYIGRFDVCIMPFKVNALTRDVNPVKMYEYLAAGKPVVSTCLPEVEQFGYVCMVSKTADEFIQNVHQALLENSLSETQRQQLQESRISVAPSNSWDIRVQSILDVVEQCFENRNPYLS